MGGMTYTNLLNEAIDLYLKGEYAKAYKLITENGMKVKGNAAQIYNFRYSFASKAGWNELAIEIMKEAVIEKGYWYSYNYLLGDDDLKPLQEYSEFHKLTDICKDSELEAVRTSNSEMKILYPESTVSDQKHHRHPFLIALHGNGENIPIIEDYWKPCLSRDYILALPQSSTIEYSDAYFWNDVIKGSNELKQQYEKALSEVNTDRDNIIIGGFSAGAKVALYSMLNDVIKVKGYIFVGPWLPEIDEWEHLLDKLSQKGTKGYIICGDKDEDCFDCTGKFVDMLNKRNMPNKYKVIKDLKHDYPNNFDKYLKEAIEFING